VRYCGDAVALVLAEERASLRKALNLISIDIEPLPAVFTVETAMEQGAVLVHEDNPQGNLLLRGDLETGSGEAAFAECAAVAEACFEVPYQEHAYLETEAGWAIFKENGSLDIVVSTQTPFRDCVEVAEALGLDREPFLSP